MVAQLPIKPDFPELAIQCEGFAEVFWISKLTSQVSGSHQKTPCFGLVHVRNHGKATFIRSRPKCELHRSPRHRHPNVPRQASYFGQRGKARATPPMRPWAVWQSRRPGRLHNSGGRSALTILRTYPMSWHRHEIRTCTQSRGSDLFSKYRPRRISCATSVTIMACSTLWYGASVRPMHSSARRADVSKPSARGACARRRKIHPRETVQVRLWTVQ